VIKEKHTHDTSGRRDGPYTSTDGVKVYTYYQVYCTCGTYMENDITNVSDKPK